MSHRWPQRIRPLWPNAGPYGPLLLLPMGFLAAFFVVPILLLLQSSFTEPVFGLQHYRLLLDSVGLQRTFLNTFKLAALTTLFAVVVAYLLAYAIVHLTGFWSSILIAAVVFCFWVSALIRALAWLMLLGSNGPVNSALLQWGLVDAPLRLIHSDLGVLIGMVHFTIPVAVLPMVAQMKGIDRRILMAAQSIGAGAVTRFVRVYLPLSLPGVEAAATFAFILGLGFYIIPSLLGSGQNTVISEYISAQVLDYARWGPAAMSGVVLLVSTSLVLAVARRLFGIRLDRVK